MEARGGTGSRSRFNPGLIEATGSLQNPWNQVEVRRGIWKLVGASTEYGC